ncbi:succinyl-CoA synthetase subunit beta [Jannaschia sp. W003]|uniref:succinyl-CoA synthetase subunit beta n=1 Tax=Jannaschia sp. W003 TaxID=2867012 RepID=UPI0021A40CBD|nr:succinyl-CoA synthetase subunit beta [Jannaschia sp. W003]UWQ21693.1 succinyl-CoA synthetase subunit beta [Jannaschia sp. W003]
MTAFAENCFSPLMTAERAEALLAPTGARVDFYDSRPFSDAPPSTTGGRAPTPGTDRRCEVAFDGDHADAAVEAAVAGLLAEGIRDEAPLPRTHAAADGTALLAARYLNPSRVAVVHVGTRPGPDGTETYMQVERLAPRN